RLLIVAEQGRQIAARGGEELLERRLARVLQRRIESAAVFGQFPAPSQQPRVVQVARQANDGSQVGGSDLIRSADKGPGPLRTEGLPRQPLVRRGPFLTLDVIPHAGAKFVVHVLHDQRRSGRSL